MNLKALLLFLPVAFYVLSTQYSPIKNEIFTNNLGSFK